MLHRGKQTINVQNIAPMEFKLKIKFDDFWLGPPAWNLGRMLLAETYVGVETFIYP